MADVLKELYGMANNAKLQVGSYDVFSTAMADTSNRRELYNLLTGAGYNLGEYNLYSDQFTPKNGYNGEAPSEEFDPSADGYDYDTANQYELKPDSTGHWPSRVPDTGRILKGENHETFNQTIASETELGNVVYRGDDGLI